MSERLDIINFVYIKLSSKFYRWHNDKDSFDLKTGACMRPVTGGIRPCRAFLSSVLFLSGTLTLPSLTGKLMALASDRVLDLTAMKINDMQKR